MHCQKHCAVPLAELVRPGSIRTDCLLITNSPTAKIMSGSSPLFLKASTSILPVFPRRERRRRQRLGCLAVAGGASASALGHQHCLSVFGIGLPSIVGVPLYMGSTNGLLATRPDSSPSSLLKQAHPVNHKPHRRQPASQRPPVPPPPASTCGHHWWPAATRCLAAPHAHASSALPSPPSPNLSNRAPPPWHRPTALLHHRGRQRPRRYAAHR